MRGKSAFHTGAIMERFNGENDWLFYYLNYLRYRNCERYVTLSTIEFLFNGKKQPEFHAVNKQRKVATILIGLFGHSVVKRIPAIRIDLFSIESDDNRFRRDRGLFYRLRRSSFQLLLLSDRSSFSAKFIGPLIARIILCLEKSWPIFIEILCI